MRLTAAINMRALRRSAVSLLFLILVSCGWTVLDRNAYPSRQIQQLSLQLKTSSETLRCIESDDDFRRKWPILRKETETIDGAMQQILKFSHSQNGTAEFLYEDYIALDSAREEYFEAFSDLENTVSAENSKLARSLLRCELDPKTATFQRIAAFVTEFTKRNRLALSLSAAVLIWVIGMAPESCDSFKKAA